MGYPFGNGCCCSVTRDFSVKVTGCSTARAGESVAFKLNGSAVGTATTDGAGVATITGLTVGTGDVLTATDASPPTGFVSTSITWDHSGSTWTAASPGTLALTLASGYSCSHPGSVCCDWSGHAPYPSPWPGYGSSCTITFKGASAAVGVISNSEVSGATIYFTPDKPAHVVIKDCTACGQDPETSVSAVGGTDLARIVVSSIQCADLSAGTWQVDGWVERYVDITDCYQNGCDPGLDWFDTAGFSGQIVYFNFSETVPNLGDCSRGELLLSVALPGTSQAITYNGAVTAPYTCPGPTGTVTISN